MLRDNAVVAHRVTAAQVSASERARLAFEDAIALISVDEIAPLVARAIRKRCDDARNAHAIGQLIERLTDA
jgi:hypothetical protein